MRKNNLNTKAQFLNLTLGAFIAMMFVSSFSMAVGSVRLSGTVTDYSGKPLDSVFVVAMNANFSPGESTFTDAHGQYTLELEKGKYMAILAVRMNEYPRFSTLNPEDQRLEFWAWNYIADQDRELNIQYHRLEIYGLNVFRIFGASPGYTIYCRPMSLTRLQNQMSKMESGSGEVEMNDIAPDPDELEIEVEINGKPVKVNMAQKVKEFTEEGSLFGYLLHVDFNEDPDSNPVDVFRVFMKDKANGDKGEAMYFLKNTGYF